MNEYWTVLIAWIVFLVCIAGIYTENKLPFHERWGTPFYIVFAIVSGFFAIFGVMALLFL